MKFIFPKNYNLKNKLLGIIDYSSLLLNVIWDFFIFCLLNLFISNITVKIFVFTVLCLPLFFFSIWGINNENVFQVIIYILKYLFKPKIYLFYKNN